MSLAPDAAFTFGVSVMTDSVSGVLMDLAGRPRGAFVDPLDVASRQAVTEHLRRRLDSCAAEAGIDRSRIFGVGVATTGYFVGGAAVNAPAGMDDWALVDLEDILAEAFGLPVWLENDGNAGAAGESLFGAGQRFRNFAYLHVAKGLGGGVVLDGQLIRGLNGNAGEFTGILPPAERAHRPTLALLAEILAERGAAPISIAEIVRNFDPNWPGVETWLERTRPALSAIVSSIAAVLDPEAIIIGGLAPKPLAAMMAERVSYYGVPTRGRERAFPPILAAEATGDAAALGAAAIPFKEHFFG
jgi:predicted NBD/HSP70 family sugar kinase